MSSSIFYSISPRHPQAHSFVMRCLINDPDSAGQVVSLPSWIPGSYMIRDFAKNVTRINASAKGGGVPMEKLDKDSWRCDPCIGPLQIEYEVYAWDPSVRTARLDEAYGFFNGTSVFLRVHGKEESVCSVDIQPSDWCRENYWQVATGLDIKKIDSNGFGEYGSDNYDALIDYPVLMGALRRCPFKAGGVEHEMVLVGHFDLDEQRLTRDLAILCSHHINFFQSPAPMERYVFLVQVTTSGYGGLEHRNSSALMCSRDDLPVPGVEKMSDAYRTFLGLCSHEYFHSWNVKRIRPQAFVPYDLNHECYTRDLWVFEGITSYYDDQALCRCGLINAESYLELLGQTITRYLRTPGRRHQTLAESSFEAWTKFYKQDENAANAIVSYYTKGALVALCLDLQIRTETAGKKSLDDVMCLLWQRYGQTNEALPEGGAIAVVNEICGKSQDRFFDQALHSTAELPLQALLSGAGVVLNQRIAMNAQDKGGKEASETLPKVATGMRVQAENSTLRISHVLRDGPAQRAGLAPGDILVAIDNVQVSSKVLERLCQQKEPGDTIAVHLFRDSVLQLVNVVLAEPEADTAFLTMALVDADDKSVLWFH